MLRPRDAWMDDAACRGMGDLFLAELVSRKRFVAEVLPDLVRRVRQVCITCPVFDTCLAQSLDRFPEFHVGFYAGYSELDRWEAWKQGQRLSDWREEENLGLAEFHPQIKRSKRPAFNAKEEDGRYNRTRARASSPPEKRMASLNSRPSCPQGHGRIRVARKGAYSDGAPRWFCYACPPGMKSFREEGEDVRSA